MQHVKQDTFEEEREAINTNSTQRETDLDHPEQTWRLGSPVINYEDRMGRQQVTRETSQACLGEN